METPAAIKLHKLRSSRPGRSQDRLEHRHRPSQTPKKLSGLVLYLRRAVTVISTRAGPANLVTPTVVRVGRGSLKYVV